MLVRLFQRVCVVYWYSEAEEVSEPLAMKA
jgi:hypothetical protein